MLEAVDTSMETLLSKLTGTNVTRNTEITSQHLQ